MNPNRLSRELRKLPGNIRSPRLPGGTLVSAVLDRQLMGWSDRGGASRIFGDIWSEHCWDFLSNGASNFNGAGFDHARALVIRLDDNPKIAIQAGRHKLPNPDFLILHPESDGSYSVRAVDAKFAVDRLRRIQISPESIRELIELPNSLARQELKSRIGEEAIDRLTYEAGVFLGPNSLLNDYFYRRLTTGDAPEIPEDELYLVSVDSVSLFSRVEEHSLMRLMQWIDELSATTPESDMVLGMYYLRLASAARWFQTQAQMPLLALETPEPPAISEVYATAEKRIRPGESAYGLIESWSIETNRAIARQKQVQDAARLPIRMSEIRKLLEARGLGEEKKLLRQVRGALERQFLHQLISEIGPIPAAPGEPLDAIIQRVGSASRELRPDLLRQADRVVVQIGNEDSTPEQID